MPRRPTKPRRQHSPLYEKRLKYLKKGETGDKFLTQYSAKRPSLETLWGRHGAAIIREHVKALPCTRPPGWWLYDAPDDYRRLVAGKGGGEFGPTPSWRRLWDHIPDLEMVDVDDPAQVESEAAFLLRHEQLTGTELDHLAAHTELLQPIVYRWEDPDYGEKASETTPPA